MYVPYQHPIYAKVVRMHSETQPICYDFAKQHQNCGLFHTSVKEGSHPMYANPGSRQDIYCTLDSQIVFCSNPRSREYPSNPVVCEVVLSLPYMLAFNCSCYLYLHIYVYRVYHKGIIHWQSQTGIGRKSEPFLILEIAEDLGLREKYHM